MKGLKSNRRTTEELMRLMNNPTAEELEQNPNMNNDAPMIGKYGYMFQEYLKTNYPGRFKELVLAITLRRICAEVNKEATEMMLTVQEQLRTTNPRPKTGDYMKLLQYETMIRNTAEEIILQEFVYKYR